mmetsp:Transcript_74866/g.165324  ORF Transcript_74866/g.165324 Transcript_74866/m.165324 type:complete len:183 (+) Transcript_74866:67-615(+)
MSQLYDLTSDSQESRGLSEDPRPDGAYAVAEVRGLQGAAHTEDDAQESPQHSQDSQGSDGTTTSIPSSTGDSMDGSYVQWTVKDNNIHCHNDRLYFHTIQHHVHHNQTQQTFSPSHNFHLHIHHHHHYYGCCNCGRGDSNDGGHGGKKRAHDQSRCEDLAEASVEGTRLNEIEGPSKQKKRI